jgi:hypothetical protein
VDELVARSHLATQLRRLRTHAISTQRQVTDGLSWPTSNVSRIEQGTIRTGVTDLQAFLDLYRLASLSTALSTTCGTRAGASSPCLRRSSLSRLSRTCGKRLTHRSFAGPLRRSYSACHGPTSAARAPPKPYRTPLGLGR